MAAEYILEAYLLRASIFEKLSGEEVLSVPLCTFFMKKK